MRFLSLYSINYEIPSGRTVDRHFAIKRLVEVSIIALQLSRESYTGLSGLTTIDSNEEQPLNAAYPIEVTPSGMTMDSKDSQNMNVLSPIEVTPSGMTMNSKEEQPQNASSPIEVTPSGIIILPEASIEHLTRTPPSIVRYSFIYLSGYKLVSIYELKIVKFYHPTFQML